ncbi:dTMP kinase [Streptacidiphilus sp. BW17]|uniref:dTMP kinase n=1 Tax=Streptacidiphilus sp. BW17 TaxID=3156274 RepID=UPI0035197354
MNATRGTLVTIDGPNGVGKSTVATALTELLTDRDVPVHHTSEPSKHPIGAFIRSVVEGVSGYALACLVAADRYDHLDAEIRPKLARGFTVVCDRYLASSLVLQQLDGVDPDFVLDLHAEADLPDLAVIATADPEEITRRIAARGMHDRFDRDPLAPTRESDLYTGAADLLREMKIPVLVLDLGQLTPAQAAEAIACALAQQTTSAA